jgi:hypothetical protein
MKVDNLDVFFNEYKTFIRDFKMDSFDEKSTIEAIVPKKSLFSFLYWKGNNKLKELMDIGGIIVGSQALKFYNCDNIPLITRKCDDWDIVLDKNSFTNFCNKNNLYNMDYQSNVIRVNFKTGIFVGYDSYPSYKNEKNYLFKHEFDIFAKDEVPDFIEVGNYRISKLENILDEKIKLIKEEIKSMVSWADYESKHYLDCNEAMTKIKSYKNEQNLY